MKKICTTVIYKTNIKNNKAIANCGRANIYMINQLSKLQKHTIIDTLIELSLKNRFKRNRIK